MARFFGADVLDLLSTLLTAQLPEMITMLQTERSDTGLEPVRKINTGYLERQFPECLISLEDSEIDVDAITMDIQSTPEIFPAEIVIVMKDITAKNYLRQEYYIEALTRILHGYHDSNISWIVVKNGIRANMYTPQNETLRVVGVSIDVRIL